MIRTLPIILTATLVAAPAALAEPKRHADAHVHGHGTLNIAIEKNEIEMEFKVPGADIVGFEHEATTKAQKDALRRARTTLKSPASMVTIPAGAGCKIDDVEIEHEREDHHAKHDDHGKHKDHGKKDAEHSEFHVEYEFECTDPSKATTLAFPYFKAFPNAKELDVTVIGPKGQTKFEVTRENPRIDLTPVM